MRNLSFPKLVEVVSQPEKKEVGAKAAFSVLLL